MFTSLVLADPLSDDVPVVTGYEKSNREISLTQILSTGFETITVQYVQSGVIVSG